jgi:hypothetical protein
MSDELTAVEESVTKFLLDLMTKRVMSNIGVSTGVQASSTRGLLTSPSIARVGPSRLVDEKRTQHRDDLANAKLISSILPAYQLPPLSGAINHDSVPKEFEYTLDIAYLPKWIRTVHTNQYKIATLNFSDFNLGDRKVYNMLALHKYLTRTKGKNSKIVPHSWTMNLAQSTLLNFMNIPHFGRHQEVNACINLLLSCYHGRYLWLNRRITVDPTLINRITGISMQGPDPQHFYPGKTTDHALAQTIKDTYDDKGHVRLQGSLYPEWCSVLSLSIDHRKVSSQEPTHPSDWICSRPRRKVRGGPTNELGEVPRKLVGTRLQGRAIPRI